MVGPDRVTLREGALDVEISYGAEAARERAGAPAVGSPALSVTREGGPSFEVTGDDIAVPPGTVVRFLPR